MALVGNTCCGLCMFLGIFLVISTVFCADDYNFYKNDLLHNQDERFLKFRLMDDELLHFIRKRNVETQKPVQVIHKQPNASSESPSLFASSTLNPNIVQEKTARLLDTTSDIANLTVQKRIKNLGENGTGIRHNVTVSTPNLIHDIGGINSTFDNEDDEITSEIESEKKSFNETLRSHNITDSKEDPNRYYNKTVYNDVKMGKFYWVELGNRSEVKVNSLLSDSHRRAATVKLSFDFPFYGHPIKNVTIATGGFLYTGDYVHSWLAATQYIAPLMANFDTSLSNDSFIRYHDNGTAFTVEWERVALQDRPADGEFTFQVTLFKNGNIVFVYKNLPLSVDQIREHHHPVKVGLSDAYIMDQTVFLVRRKTIYEYDRFHMNKTEIKNWTAIYLTALPTCHDFHDCSSCLSSNITTECRWCPSSDKCSVGFDRNRQEWLARGCAKQNYSDPSLCAAKVTIDRSHVYNKLPDIQSDDALPESYAGQVMYSAESETVGVSGIIAILFLIAIVVGISFWVVYAYRNPHTTSGQMLIRYRPSQWRWRRGEARYTAATIHM